VGTPKPAPWKAKEFERVDKPSALASIHAAREAGISHFIYISVAQPAPVMKAYIRVRSQCEHVLRSAGLRATVLRPWYVLGPGHWWPYALLPLYRLMESIPATRDTAKRLRLVTQAQMVNVLVWAVENAPSEWRVLNPEDIARGDYERAIQSGMTSTSPG
jgi:uncharacterized protein YbjT (DUF2867 family)